MPLSVPAYNFHDSERTWLKLAIRILNIDIIFSSSLVDCDWILGDYYLLSVLSMWLNMLLKIFNLRKIAMRPGL